MLVHVVRPGIVLILVCLVLAGCPGPIPIPDLPRSEAARIISRALEFNRYARLLTIERVYHLKDSMETVSYGIFTFVYLNAASGTPPIKGFADFRYTDRGWHLNQFDYGCDHSLLDSEPRLADCHTVQCDISSFK